MNAQITPSELKALMDRSAVRILDGSWALDGTDMQALFRNDHIPGATFFDLDAISDHESDLPHMAPSPEQFAAAVGAMGIAASDHVVIYDRQGLFSAARVWWTFRLMGHEHVHVLRGGLPAWKAAGYATTEALTFIEPAGYKPNFIAGFVADQADILHKSPTAIVLDARPAARFAGTAPEPRNGLRSGHMPGSLSLPASSLIRDGALLPEDDLRQIFTALGVTEAIPVITTCGSGVTAAILSMALHVIGHDRTALYDGSWAEWGRDTSDTPVAILG